MTVSIPDSHRELLGAPYLAILTTMMPDGQPQSSMVWVDYDGEFLLVNTAQGRRKTRNMQANPKVTVLVVDPQDTSRWIEVRGRVENLTAEEAEAHADKLTQRYTGKQRFYGDIYTEDQRHTETRIVVKIAPIKVSLDAIFR